MAKKKKAESIWTKDITPGVVAFMNKDVTTAFDHPVWTTDITHHIVGSLAVFALGLSCLVTTLGVAAIGVNIQLALAGEGAPGGQSAALALGERVDHPMMMPASTSNDGRRMPAVINSSAAREGSTTLAMMGSSTLPALACPKISKSLARGARDGNGTSTGEISELQRFMANHYNLNISDVVSGYFGSTTASYLERFQQEQGIPQAPVVGPLTRAAIQRLCGDPGKGQEGDRSMASSSKMMGDIKGEKDSNPGMEGEMRHGSSTLIGSTTMPVRPPHGDEMRDGSNTAGSTTMPTIEHRKLPPAPTNAPVPPTPTSFNTDNSSNAASAVEAVAEIGDGFAKLTQAYLSVFGL